MSSIQTAGVHKADRNTADRHSSLIEKMIFADSATEAKAEIGEHESDEPYFGAIGIRGGKSHANGIGNFTEFHEGKASQAR